MLSLRGLLRNSRHKKGSKFKWFLNPSARHLGGLKFQKFYPIL